MELGKNWDATSRLYLRLLSAAAIVLTLLAAISCQDDKSTPPPEGRVVVDSVPSADGVMINYQTQGTGEHDLLFVHGWGMDRSYYQDQLGEFSNSYRIVAIDLAGHGLSGKNRTDWSIANFGEDIAAVVSKLDLKDVVLIGHSMGGPSCIEAARRLPGRVNTIIGVDVFQDLNVTPDHGPIDKWLAGFETDFAGEADQFVRLMFGKNADSLLVKLVAANMSMTDPTVGVAALRSVILYDYAEALNGFDIPLRSINGDKWVTEIEQNRKLVPSYEAEIIEDAGHFVHMEKPAEFNASLLKVLVEIWPPSTGLVD